MNRLTEAFMKARHENRPALIPYVTAGFPHLDQLPTIVQALTEAGSDIIEIGIPFSDPLADGPVLQRAATEALRNGTRIKDILAAVKLLTPKSPPMVFLTYINPVFHYGIEAFSDAARTVGIEGLIIPDLPWMEGRSMRQAAAKSGIAIIPLVAPTSTEAHLLAIREAQGFVYGVSVTGVTGVRSEVDTGVESLVARVKAVVDLPVAVGFGISSAEQAVHVGRVADGVIVGSALVKAIADNPAKAGPVTYEFVHRLRMALDNMAAKA